MIETNNVDSNREISKEEFLKEKFYLSFSSLGKLLSSPKIFYRDYILKEREELEGKHLKEGELLHCFVLEPENFDDKFIVMPAKVPGGGLKIVIDNVFKTYAKPQIKKGEVCIIPKLEDLNAEILNELKLQDLYQTLVSAKRKDSDGLMLTADQKRLQKVITPETEIYWSALIEGERKTIVDMDMVTKSKIKAQAILSTPKALKLLTTNTIKTDVRKEVELKCELSGYPFGLKGIIDCVLVDYENETIYITDLKTTSKELKDWESSVDMYRYWLQAVIYKELILALVPDDNNRPWKLKFNFIVVDKNNMVYPYPVSAQSLALWELKAKEEYDKAKWHFDNHIYNLPYEYELGLVEL